MMSREQQENITRFAFLDSVLNKILLSNVYHD